MRHRPLAWLFASALLACAVAVSAEEAGEIPGPEVSPIATDRPTDSASPVLVPRHMIQFEMGVMRDRPRLARSLTARPRVKDWIIARFDEADPPLFWDSAPTVSGRAAELDARDPEATFVRVRESASGIDQLSVLVFELHNEQGYEVFEAIHERAVRGGITREEFATLCLEQEWRSMVEAREFFVAELDDLTQQERSEARAYYRLRYGPDTLEEHLLESLERGFDLRDHFRQLYDTEVRPERP